MYVLECSDKTLYCGITTDLSRRLSEHNGTTRGAKYTRSRRPVRIVASEIYQTRSSALRAEAAFKRLSRNQKMEWLSTRVGRDI